MLVEVGMVGSGYDQGELAESFFPLSPQVRQEVDTKNHLNSSSPVATVAQTRVKGDRAPTEIIGSMSVLTWVQSCDQKISLQPKLSWTTAAF